jgi:regulator of sigma E protease
MTIQSIITFIGILFLLVTVHEFGHFILAKLFKMRVDEFAFGFPPRLLSKKKGETTYSINLIPLGGYVKIFGENGLDEEELKKLSDHDRKRLFGNKPAWQRILVLCGGVAFNIVCAAILFTVAYMYGSNIFIEQKDLANYPASERKLLLVDINPKSSLTSSSISVGDSITSLSAEGETLTGDNLSSYSTSDFIQRHVNSQIFINFLKSDGEMGQVIAIAKPGIVDGKKILGAKFADTTYKKYSFGEAIIAGIDSTYEQVTYIFVSLGTLVHDMIYKGAKVEDNLSGPIGLAVMTSKVSKQGMDEILNFAGLLSLSLAVFNILPIPALDGGRIVFVLYEVFRRKKVNATTEQLFHGIGFLALLCLMVFVTYFDIVKALAS